MSRCVACNRVLLHGELVKKLPDGSYNDMCNVCIGEARYPKDWHEHQLEHITEPLFSVYGRHFTQSVD